MKVLIISPVLCLLSWPLHAANSTDASSAHLAVEQSTAAEKDEATEDEIAAGGQS